ncbi:alpha-galactosidase [Paenibacillus sp. GCM10023250]|uniref:alpha-galactosidase n=1 Tax=Paenibacillus sp. GCM10023250 TaxID=3252648 RepID=UPI00361EE027
MKSEQTRIAAAIGESALTIDNGALTLTVDLAAGTYGAVWREGASLAGAAAAFRLGGRLLSTETDYRTRAIEGGAVRGVEDALGRGVRATVRHEAAGLPIVRQHFTVYEAQPCFVASFELEAAGGAEAAVASNYMAPLSASSPAGALYAGPDGEREALAVLRVPFDNDKWVRYEAVALPGAAASYEAAAVYEPASRRGVVLGSIRHDAWKTGLTLSSGSATAVASIAVFGGAADELTRDSIPHGALSGRSIASPDIWIGAYADYRRGLEAFGRANAAIAPALPWTHGVPFGWNSWSAAADKLDYDLYASASDFLREMRAQGFHNDGVLYINFDSFWTNLTPEELERAVARVKSNGQKAGIYWTPFAFWGKDTGRAVEGTDGRYTCGELLLRDREGRLLPDLDGGLAIDPTHPGNLQRTAYHLNRFVEWGFDYVKLDFLGHGALEGRHYDASVQTGIQAYHVGMDNIRMLLDPVRIGRPFHINLSIAPLFPSIYGHSRRISCDAFGLLSDTEYMLNALTGAWWANDALYRFNDPDHTVLYKSFNQDPTGLHEGRSRLNASVVSGTVLLLGDDFRKPEARERASEWLPNAEVLAVAQLGRTFVPVEGHTGSSAADAFLLDMEEDGARVVLLAVFNFDKSSPAVKTIPLGRVVPGGDAVDWQVKELWSGAVSEARGELRVPLEAAESVLLKLTAR